MQINKIHNLLFIGTVLFLTGCKPDVQPVKVPLAAPDNSEYKAPCQDKIFAGFPSLEVKTKDTFFICREGYALNFNPETKNAEWVVYKLTAENLNKKDNFKDFDDSRPDPLISKKQRTELNDYKGNGYVKAKYAPEEHFKYDDVLYSHTHYLSNATVIHPSRVEQYNLVNEKIKELAINYGEVFIISGPVYEGGGALGWVGIGDKNTHKSTKGKIKVPTHFYKIIEVPSIKNSFAILIPNTPIEKGGNIQNVSVSQVENMTKIRFSPDLSKSDRLSKLGF